MKFELTDEQFAQFKVWEEGQRKKAKTLDATGFRYSFQFIPSSFGMTVKVVDLCTKDEIDLSEEI